MLKRIGVFAALSMALIAGSCESDSKVASRNISRAAEQFEINRRISFINGITDSYLLTIEGFCSVDPDSAGKKLDVTCKNPNGFDKHYLGLSDNVTYISEQLDSVNVSVYHSRVIFKPQSIIPDVDFVGSMDELTK